MITPTKADIGRIVTCRVYKGHQGHTVRGRITGLSKMTVEVKFDGIADPEFRNRSELEWADAP